MKAKRVRLSDEQRRLAKLSVKDASNSADFVAADTAGKRKLLRTAVFKVYDTLNVGPPSKSGMERLIQTTLKKHTSAGSPDTAATAAPGLTKLASADDLDAAQLSRLQDKLQNKVNSAEFMMLTKAKERSLHINEAITNVLAVTCGLKASMKVVKSVWKDKLEPSVALPAAAQNAGGAEDGDETVTRDDLLVRVEPPTPKPKKATIKNVVAEPDLFSAAAITKICGKLGVKALKLIKTINRLGKTAVEKSPGSAATTAFGVVVSYPVNDARPGKPTKRVGRPQKKRATVAVVSPGRHWHLMPVAEAMSRRLAESAGTAASRDSDIEVEFLPSAESVDDSSLAQSLRHAPSADKFAQATPEKANASIFALLAARSLRISPPGLDPI
jgi:hypothetical protein